MSLRIGQMLRGAKWNYRLIEALNNHIASSDVSKAEIIHRTESQFTGKWAVIKTSSQQNILAFLKHEHDYYMNPVIRSSFHFRAMYDAINVHSSSVSQGSYCLAFERMGCALKNVTSKSHERNSRLHKSLAEGVLGALAELKS
ncbi:hypothetical protein GQ44DRAFT_372052 [Phaeosphaeriaceae sp. PMI808]|nr:hypothetical protein GQ44DRAFT_372052 [Phaeosphaeriaceae sp. PMI808]